MSRLLPLLQSALQAASNGVLITDATLPDNPIIYANPGFERLSGYCTEEILGSNCRFLQGPDTDRDTVRQIREAVSDGEFLTVEIYNYKKDGTPFWNELAISPVKNESGVVTHFIGIQSEITDRREKERAQRAQLLAENVVDTVREPLVILNDDHSVQSANRSFYRFFQTTPEDTIGKNLYEIEDGSFDVPALKTLLERILPQKNLFDDFELAHDFPRIGPRTLHLNARRVDRSLERPEYILLAMEDITHLRTNEVALHESEQRYKLVIEGLRDFAILTTDPRGHITTWNSGAERIFGYPAPEVLGQSISILFTPSDATARVHDEEMRQAVDEGKARAERWMKRRDGGAFWASGVLAVLNDEAGHLKGFAKLLQDDTERKRLEEELVLNAQALAERDRAKDEFLAMLGHELRNPLGAISNAVQVAKLLGTDENLKRTLDVAARQATQMNSLVGDLLDVARVTQGKITLKQEHVSLDAIVASVAQSVEAQATRKGIALKVSPDAGVQVYGDATRLEQIVSNLLTNAIKYTEAGEVSVRLKREGAHAVLTVRDTGMGIDSALLPRLFDLFSQAKRSLARSEGGLGIGLTIVQRLVELHGGEITARSEGEGKGSEFRVSLPLSHAALQEEGGGEGSAMGDGRVKILVVDDNKDAADVFAMMLELWGYRVETTGDGEEAIARAVSSRPAVMLLDIGLPKLSGYEVAEALRLQPSLRALKIIAVTGYGQEMDLQKSRDSGFNEHLLKPVDFSTLKDLLASYASEV